MVKASDGRLSLHDFDTISNADAKRNKVGPSKQATQWRHENANALQAMRDRIDREGVRGEGSRHFDIHEWRAATQPLTIKVSTKLIESATDDGLDLAQLFETVGTQAVRDALAAERKRQNADFIQAANEELERNGLWNEKYRLW